MNGETGTLSIPLPLFPLPLVRSCRERLIWTEIVRAHVRKNEILRRHRRAGEPPEDGYLANVSHRVCKGSLQHSLCRNALEWCAEF